MLHKLCNLITVTTYVPTVQANGWTASSLVTNCSFSRKIYYLFSGQVFVRIFFVSIARRFYSSLWTHLPAEGLLLVRRYTLKWTCYCALVRSRAVLLSASGPAPLAARHQLEGSLISLQDNNWNTGYSND